MKLYYLGKPSDGFGWGVANTNLVRELANICDVKVETTDRDKFDAPVFVPITDSSLKPLRWVKRAPMVIGYCFTEWPLNHDALHYSKRYDLIFCGSTWNTNRLRQVGIKNVATLIQGVDFERFKVAPPSQRKGFVVFSGGKLEFRKGQDYVAAAMRTFMGVHADAVLLAAWHNPWPQSIASMSKSWLMDPAKQFDGLPPDRVFPIPPIPNDATAHVYAQSHVGLFPNRCEAGTNMVMTEYMATGRAVIATNATGHTDVLGGPGPYRLDNGAYDPAGWFNCNVSDILEHLEHAYAHREELIERGLQCRRLVERFTWSDCAKKIVEACQ